MPPAMKKDAPTLIVAALIQTETSLQKLETLNASLRRTRKLLRAIDEAIKVKPV